MNSPPPSPREEDLFHRALALPAADRAAFLERECAGDAALRAAVASLLRLHGSAESFLRSAAPELAAPEFSATLALNAPGAEEKPGARIGRYKLLEKIGEGGFGTVYMAEQEEPVRRRVALKVIKLGMDTKEVVARFEAERQALAMMDHPNIAKVFDGGATTAGRPYFVMELVKGVPITTYCDQRQLSTPARLELFMLVCQAVQHAHQKGVIHRDLKPSNILVTEQDDRAVPKVIDFGVARATQAKLTEKTMFTQFHQLIGTPAYMSPEQTGLANLDIDTRSDIYSLGVLLYELLTGCTPFDAKKLLEAGYEGIMRMIREVEPPKPSTRLSSLSVQELTDLGGRRQEEPRRLGRRVQGDLDWIVMKALEKDRSRRYETASALAADLQRHLGNEPVVARPASNLYRLEKIIRRNRLACAAGAVIAASLVVGVIAATWAYLNEKTAREIAVEAVAATRRATASNRLILDRAADYRRQAEKAAVESARSAYAVAFMKSLFPSAESASDAEKWRIRELLAPTADRLRADAHIPREAKQELCEILGDLHMALGAFAQAELLYRQTVALRRELSGDGSPETDAAVQKLIEAMKRQGKIAEAAQTIGKARDHRAEYFRSERRTRALKAEAATLQAQGKFAEAEGKLLAATAGERARLGDKYQAFKDLGLLARLRFEAGDIAGARQLAEHCILAEKSSRLWRDAGTFGPITQGANKTYVPPYDAHSILGLIALRAGDKAEARAQLLRSAAGVTPFAKFGRKEIELAATLVAAGEQRAVREFLDCIRPEYVGSLEARHPSNILLVTTYSQFNNAGLARLHAQELATWQAELSAGRMPADWEKLLATGGPAAPASPPALPSAIAALVPSPPPPAPLLHPLFPFAFLMLGWCATAIAPRFDQGRRLPRAAIAWLIAFCVARTVDTALFASMILGHGFIRDMMVSIFLSFFSWVFLWEFLRALAPGEISRRETRLMRGIFAFGLLEMAALAALGYTGSSDSLQTFCVIGLFLLMFITLALAIVVCIAAGIRLWRWQHTAGLSRAQRLALICAAPQMVLHGCVSLFAGNLHDGMSPAIANAIFWFHALLPWLLAAGFFAGKSSSHPAAPHTR